MPVTFQPNIKDDASQADAARLNGGVSRLAGDKSASVSSVSQGSPESVESRELLKSPGSSRVPRARKVQSLLEYFRAHAVQVPAIAASYALMAALGFVILDEIKHRLPSDRMARPEKSTIWWAAKEFQDAVKVRKPDVVLLGSSLMIAAQNDCDATVYDKSFDVLTHYRSQFLEQVLSKDLGHEVRTASFVIGGQMASDAYSVVKVLLAGSPYRSRSNQVKPVERLRQAPQTIVWGIAPRDFVDATCSNPLDTETVKLMGRLADDDNLLQQRVPFWKGVEQRLNRTFTLLRDRDEIRSWQTDLVEGTLHTLMPAMFTPEMHAPDWLLHQAALALPEDNKPGQWICRPLRLKVAEAADNSAEYKSRYQPFKLELFQVQSDCFDATLREAREHGIKVLLVNMPLTQANMRLLPAGVYDRYLKRVQESAQLYDAQVLDLNDGKTFSAADFCDPVHLNGNGGRKFMELIARSLTHS
jgi:hypothetical protein